MNISPAAHVIFLLCLRALAADDTSNLDDGVSAAENRYSRAVNDLDVDAGIEIHERSRRQANALINEEFYVTQCSYDSSQRPDGPSIQVLGKSLNFEGATLQAAKLLHLLVRFMPRSLFLKVAEMNTVGLYSPNNLPDDVFEEFDGRPSACTGRCGIQFSPASGDVVDCAEWCTTLDYPYQQVPYPANYLWAYGNFSRLYVVETNVICQGFNPTKSENLLIREFAFMLMARIFDNQTLADIEEAYTANVANATWLEIKNKYEYFMLGTLAWFNGGSSSTNLKGMACLNIYGNNGIPLCSDAFGQRQFMKDKDMKLYKILNYVYNKNREYVNAETSVCTW